MLLLSYLKYAVIKIYTVKLKVFCRGNFQLNCVPISIEIEIIMQNRTHTFLNNLQYFFLILKYLKKNN